MGIEKDFLPILAVALITWGAVLAYMFRLDRSTRNLEQRLSEIEAEKTEADRIEAETAGVADDAVL